MRARAWTPLAMFVGALTAQNAAADERHEEGVTGASTTDPVRKGFTLELGLGAALTFVLTRTTTECFSSTSGSCGSSENTRAETFGGFAPLSLGIGGFFSEDVALLFRATATSYFEFEDNWVNGFYGPAIQIWPGDRVMLGAGAGLGVFGENPLSTRGRPEVYSGVAFEARAGYALFVNREHALRGTLEVIPGFYGRRGVVGTALLFEWQLL